MICRDDSLNKNVGLFLKKPPHTPKKLNRFFCVAVKLAKTLPNLAQITALDSGSTRANCFCSQTNKNCNLLLCIIAISTAKSLWFKVANYRFFLRLLKCRKNLLVSTRWHNLRETLTRSWLKSFWFFFQKEHYSLFN